MTLRHKLLTTVGLVGLLFLVPADSLHGTEYDYCASLEDSEEQDECYDEIEQQEEDDRAMDELDRQELEEDMDDDQTEDNPTEGGEPEDPVYVVTPGGVLIEAYSPDHACRSVKVRRVITTMVTDCWVESLGATGACGGAVTLGVSGGGTVATGFAGMVCIAGIAWVTRCVDREIEKEVYEEEEVCGD